MNCRIEWQPNSSPSPFTKEGTHRIPDRGYSDKQLHARELEAFFSPVFR